MCFVASVARSGQFGKNLFNFKNCGIKNITLFADGMLINGAPSKLSFNPTKGSTFVRAYADMGPPGVLGIWGEWLFIFRELGSTCNYFQGFGEQAHSFGDLGRHVSELRKVEE